MPCTVCLEELGPTNTITLDCGHTFHPSCIIAWFRSDHSECPLCRAQPSHQLRHMDVQTRASMLRTMARRKNASPRLIRAVQKVKEAEDVYSQTLSDLKDVKEHEAVKKYKRLLTQRSRHHRAVRKAKSKLGLLTGDDIPTIHLDIVREAVDVVSFEFE